MYFNGIVFQIIYHSKLPLMVHVHYVILVLQSINHVISIISCCTCLNLKYYKRGMYVHVK